jgi:hypothetical protein
MMMMMMMMMMMTGDNGREERRRERERERREEGKGLMRGEEVKEVSGTRVLTISTGRAGVDGGSRQDWRAFPACLSVGWRGISRVDEEEEKRRGERRRGERRRERSDEE